MLLPAGVFAGGRHERGDNNTPPAEPVPVFLETVPMGALIVLNGAPLAETTPLLLRNLLPGTYRIEFRKEGWATEAVTLELSAGQEPAIVHRILGQALFSPEFSRDENLKVNGHPVALDSEALLLPDGQYRLSRVQGDLLLDQVFPRETRAAGTAGAFYTCLAAAGLTTLDRLIDDKGHFSFSPLMGISWTASAVLGYFHIRNILDEKRFYRETEERPPQTVSVQITPEARLAAAQEDLARGRLDDAALELTRLIRENSDSPILPEALYDLSRIHLANGNVSLALAGLERIRRDYPVSSLYDKVCYTLGTLYERENRTDEAEAALADMVFADPFFDRETVREYARTLGTSAAVPEEAP